MPDTKPANGRSLSLIHISGVGISPALGTLFHIAFAMLNGMSSDDPMVNAMWKSVPRAGDIPTPEELVAFCIDEVLKDKQ